MGETQSTSLNKSLEMKKMGPSTIKYLTPLELSLTG
jgi:hypothetical protein